MLVRKITAALMSAVLVMTLSPASALASPLAAADVAQQPAKQLVAQAKKAKKTKKTVYIVTGVKITDNDGYGNVNRTAEKYNYNSKKLVKRQAATSSSAGGYNSLETTKWHYNGSNLASREDATFFGSTPVYTTFRTTAKGKVKASVTTVPGTDIFVGMDDVTTTRLSYSGGKPASASMERRFWQLVRIIDGTSYNRDCYDPFVSYSSERYYYNKKGLMRAVKSVDADGLKEAHRFAYDKKGNVKRAVSDYATYSCANKYNKKGLLKKRVVTRGDSSQKVTCKFTWKKVKVKKSLAKKVEAQQWSIVNGDMNFALGGSSYGSGNGQYWW